MPRPARHVHDALGCRLLHPHVGRGTGRDPDRKGLTLNGTTLSASSGIFASYGVGDVVMIPGVGTPDGAGALRKPLVTTIQQKGSSSSVTLASAASVPLMGSDSAVITLGKDCSRAFRDANLAAFEVITHGGSVQGEGSPPSTHNQRRMKGEDIFVPLGLYFIRGVDMHGSVSLLQ